MQVGKFDLPLKQALASLGSAVVIAAYFIYPHEGTIHHSYRDGGGVWTICKGHTEGVHENEIATDAECDKWYIDDVAKADRSYQRLVQKPQHPNVKAAALDFIFNAGAGNFASSSLRKKMNIGAARESICSEFPRWDHVAGKDCHDKASNCPGIITRRQNEKELCLSNELRVCDYNSGNCQPVGLWSSLLVSEQSGSKVQG